MTDRQHVIIISPHSLRPQIGCALIAALSSKLHVITTPSREDAFLEISFDLTAREQLADALQAFNEAQAKAALPVKQTAYSKRNVNQPWYRQQRKRKRK